VVTFPIITAAADDDVAPRHDRMPAIIGSPTLMARAWSHATGGCGPTMLAGDTWLGRDLTVT
jgi:hypothetical protein